MPTLELVEVAATAVCSSNQRNLSLPAPLPSKSDSRAKTVVTAEDGNKSGVKEDSDVPQTVEAVAKTATGTGGKKRRRKTTQITPPEKGKDEVNMSTKKKKTTKRDSGQMTLGSFFVKKSTPIASSAVASTRGTAPLAKTDGNAKTPGSQQSSSGKRKSPPAAEESASATGTASCNGKHVPAARRFDAASRRKDLELRKSAVKDICLGLHLPRKSNKTNGTAVVGTKTHQQQASTQAMGSVTPEGNAGENPEVASPVVNVKLVDKFGVVDARKKSDSVSSEKLTKDVSSSEKPSNSAKPSLPGSLVTVAAAPDARNPDHVLKETDKPDSKTGGDEMKATIVVDLCDDTAKQQAVEGSSDDKNKQEVLEEAMDLAGEHRENKTEEAITNKDSKEKEAGSNVTTTDCYLLQDGNKKRAVAKTSIPESQSKGITLTKSSSPEKGLPEKGSIKTSNGVGSLNTAKKEQPVLTEASRSLLKRHAEMRDSYSQRAEQVLDKCQKVQEDFCIDLPEKLELPPNHVGDSAATAAAAAFPDFAIPFLAALVEGSSKPLSVVAASATATLNQRYSTATFATEVTLTKIKEIATRKKYIDNPGIIGNESSSNGNAPLNLFEDDNPDHVWRWEVAIVDQLPADSIDRVKQARAARRKPAQHFKALAKLLQSLNKADELIVQQPAGGGGSNEKLDKLLARMSQEEERVLKYDREEQKARLALESKRQKQAGKDEERKKREQEKKKREEEKKKREEEKAQQLEEKRKERERKKLAQEQERELKRQQKEELKRKREEEERQMQETKKAELLQQKSIMLSFLKKAPSQETTKEDKPSDTTLTASASPTTSSGSHQHKPPKTSCAEKSVAGQKGSGFDADAFRSVISGDKPARDKAPLFGSLSDAALQSRKRRTKKVPVSVFVTVLPETDDADDATPFGFSQQLYAEQQDVIVNNRYKFLLFHHDVRPPYHGTWTKTSKNVTGRTPFGKDPHLDYDVDSEAEWEQGDDEIGEDLDNCQDEEEEGNDEEEDQDDEDGWLAADDEMEDDLDEETKMLRKKTIDEDSQERQRQTVTVVAPFAGKSLVEHTSSVEAFQEKKHVVLAEGFEHVDRGLDLLKAHYTVQVTTKVDLFLDAFPPAMVTEDVDQVSDQIGGNAGEQATSTNALFRGRPPQEMSTEEKKIFCRFVHHSTLGAKPTVVDEFRQKHQEDCASSSNRRLVFRMLDAFAVKKKQKSGGYYWEVKEEIRNELGLTDLAAAFPEEKEETTTSGSGVLSVKSTKDTTSAGPSSEAGKEDRPLDGRKKPNLSGSVKLLAKFLKQKRG